jgi:hypothetical protein
VNKKVYCVEDDKKLASTKHALLCLRLLLLLSLLSVVTVIHIHSQQREKTIDVFNKPLRTIQQNATTQQENESSAKAPSTMMKMTTRFSMMAKESSLRRSRKKGACGITTQPGWPPKFEYLQPAKFKPREALFLYIGFKNSTVRSKS